MTKWVNETQDCYGKQLKKYTQWLGMNHRPNTQKYKCGTTIHESFLSYDVYLEWAKDQIGWLNVEDSGRIWSIDNDIVGDGSIYSPEVCVFVPAVINNFNTNKTNHNSLGHKGVVYRGSLYYVQTRRFGKYYYGGSFRNINDAVAKYQELRLEYLMILSEKYYHLLDHRVFPNMLKKLTDNFI